MANDWILGLSLGQVQPRARTRILHSWVPDFSGGLGRGVCDVRSPKFGLQCAQNWSSAHLGLQPKRRDRVLSRPSYRALQLALRIFSVLFATGGLFMIFGSRGLVIRVLLHPPEAEVSTLLLFLLKEMGGMVLMVSTILFRAARDPERNIAVVDGLIVGLLVLTITPLLSLRTLDVQRIYPGHLVWGRSVIRLALAAFFFYLRPRGARWQPDGHF